MISPNQNKQQEKAQVKPKEYSLNASEMSELSFVASNIATFEEIANLWREKSNQVITNVLKRCNIDITKNNVDINQVFTTGRIYVTKKNE